MSVVILMFWGVCLAVGGVVWVASLVWRPRPGTWLWVRWCAARWARDCHRLGLHLIERHPAATRSRTPRLHTPAAVFDRTVHGLQAEVRTVPGVDLERVQAQAGHLANVWGCCRVDVRQSAPGRLTVTGLVRDPLSRPLEVIPSGLPLEGWRLRVGVDEDGQEVTLDLANLSGITVAGVPGAGKTSLMRWWLCQLFPHPAVKIAVLDGKVADPVDGDYGPMLDRCAAAAGDGLDDANRVLSWLYETMRARSGWLRHHRGTSQFWDDGPSVDCPLIVTVVDESHTYVSGASRKDKEVCESNVWYLTKLAKEGRSRGLVTVFVTQKQTADAIPTAIRDVCQVGISFGVRTMDGAVAALGDDIRQYPEVAPTLLIGREWTGVAVMRLPGLPGFRRVRCPLVSDKDAVAALVREGVGG